MAPSTSPKVNPASSTTGFYQQNPNVLNQWTEDVAFRRSATLLLPEDVLRSLSSHLTAFGAAVLERDIFAAIVDAEAHPPTLEPFTAWGEPNDANSLKTSIGWRYLQDFGLANGVVARGYNEDLGGSARVVQALRVALWAPSSAMVVCPSGMQDGAISVLKNDLSRPDSQLPSEYDNKTRRIRKKVFETALGHLLSEDPKYAWTSGQWMTERRGGSDVGGTETFATYAGIDKEVDSDGLPLGPWSVSGFKWFSSATDCGCALVLAWTPKGLSCFFAPTRRKVAGRDDVAMNGIRIQRLKNKLGTKALPTAELEIKGMRAWLVGDEGRGVAVIATVLNVSRFHNAARAIGFLGRGLGIARAFARVRSFPSRKAPDNYLRSVPLFCKTLARVSLRHRADTHLTLFLAALLGASNTGHSCTPLVPSDPADAALLLRLLTSVAKAVVTKNGIAGLQECMEALGGVGYLENNETPGINVARLFRDANVMSIWEGTTDVLSTDTVKVFRGKDGAAVEEAIDRWLRTTLGDWAFGGGGLGGAGGMPAERKGIVAAWRELQSWPKGREEMMPYARHVAWRIADIVSATLMVVDAERDENDVAVECARRFVKGIAGDGRPVIGADVERWDARIAFDGEKEEERRAKL